VKAHRNRARGGIVRPSRRTETKIAGTALATIVLSLARAPGAGAASKPTVATGSARSVSYASALITGSVNPNGAETYYYVQYGQTGAYGGQTAIAQAGAGAHALSVSVPLGGLQPLTLYHYRLVAVNSAGVSGGSDATFLTTKVPLSLAIAASPNPVPFGGAITIAGVLSGTGNSGRAVVLQMNAFPFGAGFQSFGNAELTGAGGGFSFPVLGLMLSAQFRVVALTSPPVYSPVALEAVAVRVDSHVARTGRAHFVRIFGTVTPALDGMQVAILRSGRHRGVLVAGTVLRHHDATSSSFSRVVRARRGDYRVLVRVTGGAFVSAYGRPLRVG
jgi:hypothetical protein